MSVPDYSCGQCGARDCKLWREYNAFYRPKALRCAMCAAASTGEDISDIDADGRRKSTVIEIARTDQIGYYIPAVPTDDGTFWGYTSVPQDGVEWWKRLPTLPV